MKRTLILVSLFLCLALLLGTLPLSACSKPKEKVLKIGMMTPSTGVAAEKGAPGGDGARDAIEYINSELGGVNGIPIQLLWRDSGYDAGKAATIIKEYMAEGALLFTTHSSAEMTYVMELANRAEFPGLAVYTAPNLYRPPQHIYGQLPDYGDDWSAFADYYMKNIWKGSGKPRMALHLLNNSTGYGARDAAKALADKMGIEIVATEEHTATSISETDSLNRIKAAKPDVLYISSTPKPTALIVKNARELGMFPAMTIGSGHAGLTKALVDLAGADIAEGVYGVFPTVSWGDNVPGMAKIAEYAQKLHPADVGNLDYLSNWAAALIAADILKTTLKTVSYEVLAKGNVESWRAVEKNGFQKINYDVAGLHGPAKYVAGDNRLAKSVRVLQIKGGKIVPVSNWVDAPLVKYEDYSWFGK
ncbi:MAG: ABC transporter substrate-binding protein [Dehalococcoidales bacterium]|nr:ABC transporter substrate-binding protein [Dehalococcoidales bacterium]